MKKALIVFIMVFLCTIIYAQDYMTEIVINGNTSYLDNLLEVDQINDFTLNELRILRNTIFAKYGYKFVSEDLTNHFLQFSWYEGTKTSVENELTSIDWKNIELIRILEDYYPTKIDYVFNFHHNGIFKLDENFNLTPIYTNDTDNVWWASFHSYTQLDDFIFFHFDGRKMLFYDYVSSYLLEIGDLGIVDVVSIYYQSENTLVVNALSYVSYQTRSQILISVTLNLPDGVIRDEFIGRTVNQSGMVGWDTCVDGNINLFSVFNKNIVTIQKNGYPNTLYPDHISINVIYNNSYNVYFILVINWGYLKS